MPPPPPPTHTHTGNLLLAQELLGEAIHMSLQIYGPMHVDIANCYR